MFERKKPERATAAIVVCRALVLTLGTASLSEQPWRGKTSASPSTQSATNIKKNTDNPDFKAERLKQPLDVPGVAPNSGKKVRCIVGTLFPRVKGGQSATLQFSTADEPKPVLEQYKQSLDLDDAEFNSLCRSSFLHCANPQIAPSARY